MQLFLAPLASFGVSINYDELECMLANLIYRVCAVVVRFAVYTPCCLTGCVVVSPPVCGSGLREGLHVARAADAGRV